MEHNWSFPWFGAKYFQENSINSKLAQAMECFDDGLNQQIENYNFRKVQIRWNDIKIMQINIQGNPKK